jgi:hypothetical protein
MTSPTTSGQLSEDRLGELIAIAARKTDKARGVFNRQDHGDTLAALQELMRLRRQLSHMTSLAGSALVQLHNAVTIPRVAP